MRLSLNILFTLFTLMTIFFVVLGITAVDFSMLFVAVLFAFAALIINLESRQYLLNPFRDEY